MRKQTTKIFFLLVVFLILPSFVFAAPSISSISGTVSDGQNVTVFGSGFGIKSNVKPVYWDNFESYTLDAAPTSGGWIVRSGTPTVSSERAYSGSKAVRFNNIAFDVFQQMSRDMGTTFPITVFFQGKIYLDNTVSPCEQYQWKNLMFSSSPGAYYHNEEINTTIVMFNSWWRSSTGYWFNTGSPHVYYNGGSSASTLDSPPTLFKFNQWFDFEFKLTRSSAPNVANGSVVITVDGVQKSSKTNFITHDGDDGIYRYMMMGGTIASCSNASRTIPFDPHFKVYYDDIYVDTTQSRIEIADVPTWSSSTLTHREIQIPSAWSDGQIQFTLNKGSFSAGQAYLYVIDANGNVNVNGYPITFTSGTDTTPPSAPTGLSVI